MRRIFILIVVGLSFNSCDQPTSGSNFDNELEGRWKFIAVERNIENQWTTDRWMQDGIGYLIYNNKGHMALHITPKGYSETKIIWNEDSLGFSSWPIFELMVEETGLYTLSNHVFTGNYYVSGDTLVHERLTHSNPKNFTQRMPRRYDITLDTLTIYPPGPNPSVRVRYLRDD